jgi:hypothetical protein
MESLEARARPDSSNRRTILARDDLTVAVRGTEQGQAPRSHRLAQAPRRPIRTTRRRARALLAEASSTAGPIGAWISSVHRRRRRSAPCRWRGRGQMGAVGNRRFRPSRPTRPTHRRPRHRGHRQMSTASPSSRRTRPISRSSMTSSISKQPHNPSHPRRVASLLARSDSGDPGARVPARPARRRLSPSRLRSRDRGGGGCGGRVASHALASARSASKPGRWVLSA